MFDFLLSTLFLLGAAWFAWQSTILVEEKKQRQRKGLTDYYDMPIKRNNDETIS